MSHRLLLFKKGRFSSRRRTAYTAASISYGYCIHDLPPLGPVVRVIGRVGRLGDEDDSAGGIVLEEARVDACCVLEPDVEPAELVQGRGARDVFEEAVFQHSERHLWRPWMGDATGFDGGGGEGEQKENCFKVYYMYSVHTRWE